MTNHIVTLEGPDAAGHYEHRCTCGEDASGYEPEEIIPEATEHGALATGQTTTLDRIAADIAADA